MSKETNERKDIKAQLSSTIERLVPKMQKTTYISIPRTPLDHKALEYFSKKENANDPISVRIPRYSIALSQNKAGHHILSVEAILPSKLEVFERNIAMRMARLRRKSTSFKRYYENSEPKFLRYGIVIDKTTLKPQLQGLSLTIGEFLADGKESLTIKTYESTRIKPESLQQMQNILVYAMKHIPNQS